MGVLSAHLHHGVPGTVVSQLSQPVDEALAGLAVDPARLHHGLALFHKLHHTGGRQFHHMNQRGVVLADFGGIGESHEATEMESFRPKLRHVKASVRRGIHSITWNYSAQARFVSGKFEEEVHLWLLPVPRV